MFRYPEARPRKGFTLTEVLMAMFVMAIGMISLLALFPAAFQQCKWALDNEQVARAAANAQSMTELPHMQVATISGFPVVAGTAQNVRNDDNYRPASGNGNSSMPWKLLALEATTSTAVSGALGTVLGRTTFLCHYDAVTDPANPTYRWTFNINTATNPAGTKVKFPPVFVDPFVANFFYFSFPNASTATVTLPIVTLPFHVGADTALSPFRTNSLQLNVSVGTNRPNRSIGIPRMTLSQFNNSPPTGIQGLTELAMSDELIFGSNGRPADGNGLQYPNAAATSFGRQNRFTWAYMCQWPDYNTPDVCDVSVVVFNSRPQTTGLTTLPAGEVTYSNPVDTLMFSKGLTQATISLGTSTQPMNLKVGDWILDSTFILPSYDPGNPLLTAPFLDTYYPAALANGLFPGLVGGHFYKVLDISSVQGTGPFYQTITLDRPAKSDGFTATILSGVADVITKSVGKMPQR